MQLITPEEQQQLARRGVRVLTLEAYLAQFEPESREAQLTLEDLERAEAEACDPPAAPPRAPSAATAAAGPDAAAPEAERWPKSWRARRPERCQQCRAVIPLRATVVALSPQRRICGTCYDRREAQ